MPILDMLRAQFSCEPLLSTPQIVVAYSGGVDSHVLLHALHRLKQQAQLSFHLSVIHIHHGLSQHSDQWQTHCQQICNQLEIDFQTANVSVQAQARQSLEALAREARYNKLVELAPTNSQVLLAQHQDDQVETFLLQLKRGAGPKGLSAMNRRWVSHCPSQPAKKVGFYRPLLALKQQLIMDYALEHQLQWCEDESNQNTDFERNFLRHDVLPILQQRWPELSISVARSAALCAQQQSLLDEICADKLKAIKTSANNLYLPALKSLSQSWLHQVVRYWLSESNIQSPPLAVLNQLRPEVLDAAVDATPVLQWNGWQFRRFDQQLYVVKVSPKKSHFNRVWQGEKRIKLPNNIGNLIFTVVNNQPTNIMQIKSDLVKSDLIKNAQTNSLQGNGTLGLTLTVNPDLGPIVLRFGGYSVRFRPLGSHHSKPLKQWFKQWKVAPWARESVLLLIQNDQVLALLLNGNWQLAQSAPMTSKNTPLLAITTEVTARNTI